MKKARPDKGMHRVEEKLAKLLAACEVGAQARLAKSLGMDQSQLSRILDPKKPNKPTPKQLLIISRFFSVQMESLVDDEISDAQQTLADNLTADQKMILNLISDLHLDRAQAVRRLCGLEGTRVPVAGMEERDEPRPAREGASRSAESAV